MSSAFYKYYDDAGVAHKVYLDEALATASGFVAAAGSEPALAAGVTMRQALLACTVSGAGYQLVLPYPTLTSFTATPGQTVLVSGVAYTIQGLSGESTGYSPARLPALLYGPPGPPGPAGVPGSPLSYIYPVTTTMPLDGAYLGPLVLAPGVWFVTGQIVCLSYNEASGFVGIFAIPEHKEVMSLCSAVGMFSGKFNQWCLSGLITLTEEHHSLYLTMWVLPGTNAIYGADTYGCPLTRIDAIKVG